MAATRDADAQQIWQAALGQLQLQVPRPSYQTWLKETVGLSLEDGCLTVGVPTPFAAEWLEKRLYALIEETVERVARRPLEVRFRVSREPGPPARLWEAPPGGNGLNRNYTFATFVVGKCNQLAHAAALAVAREPGRTYNPLVIYAGVGLGKTHLLHAVGHEVCRRGLGPLYVTAEQFTNDFVRAIQRGRADEFRQKYRRVDVLLIDDIQFIAGKEHSQEAFFHTFNQLHMAHRQIVITSDRPPRSLPLIEERLRSRFEGGLLVDIRPPDLETRMAILRAKAEQMDVHLPGEVLQFIAQRVHHSVRELEGSLNRVVAFAELTRSPVTLEMASQALADFIAEERRRPPSPQEVVAAVASFYQVEPDALSGKGRDRRTSMARQVAMYLLREVARRSPTEIGRLLGGKDHSTVIHACHRVSRLLQEDERTRREVASLREMLRRAP